jgi:hypothetical protein
MTSTSACTTAGAELWSLPPVNLSSTAQAAIANATTVRDCGQTMTQGWTLQSGRLPCVKCSTQLDRLEHARSFVRSNIQVFS